jgi:hypothetical protein
MYLWIRAFVNVLDGFVEDFYLENHALIRYLMRKNNGV